MPEKKKKSWKSTLVGVAMTIGGAGLLVASLFSDAVSTAEAVPYLAAGLGALGIGSGVLGFLQREDKVNDEDAGAK